jgi:mediator of RNA polymerase II transcription subunit 7
MDKQSTQQKEETVAVAQQQLFPPPPPYYRLVDQLEPPPIVEGTYQQFGELFTTEDGMPALHVSEQFERRQDGSIDVKKELLGLYEKLREGIDSLLTVLSQDPSSYARQLEQVGLIFRNMQYLMNELRPIQARRSLKDALRASIEDKKAALEKLEGYIVSFDDEEKNGAGDHGKATAAILQALKNYSSSNSMESRINN